MVQSDTDLIDYLVKCDSDSLHAILGFMRSRLSARSRKIVDRYPTPDSIPKPSSPERGERAAEMLKLLQWYGSNAIHYYVKRLFRKEGCHYHQILHDAAKVVNRRQKRKDRLRLPRVASVNEWEQQICEILLSTGFRSRKSPEDIATMFEEAGLDKDVAQVRAREFTPGAGIGISLPVLVRILGKKTVKNLIGQLIVHITYRRMGIQAATQFADRILAPLAQKTIAKIASGVGWTFLIVDTVFFVTSPARRITIPTVAMISCLRTFEGLKDKN